MPEETDPVREMLESRRKADLAENTRLSVATKRGIEQGEAEGERLKNTLEVKGI